MQAEKVACMAGAACSCRSRCCAWLNTLNAQASLYCVHPLIHYLGNGNQLPRLRRHHDVTLILAAVHSDGREFKRGEVHGVNTKPQGGVPRQDMLAFRGEASLLCPDNTDHFGMQHQLSIDHLFTGLGGDQQQSLE